MADYFFEQKIIEKLFAEQYIIDFEKFSGFLIGNNGACMFSSDAVETGWVFKFKSLNMRFKMAKIEMNKGI